MRRPFSYVVPRRQFASAEEVWSLADGSVLALLEESGFTASRVLKRFPYRSVRGHPFFSMTFESRKPVASASRPLRRVMYRGPFPAAR